jgi:hypothetical protein
MSRAVGLLSAAIRTPLLLSSDERRTAAETQPLSVDTYAVVVLLRELQSLGERVRLLTDAHDLGRADT